MANPNPPRRHPDNKDELAREDVRDLLDGLAEKALPTLKALAVSFSQADPTAEIVHEEHVRMAGDVLYSLARNPEIYATVGATELFVSFANAQRDPASRFSDYELVS